MAAQALASGARGPWQPPLAWASYWRHYERAAAWLRSHRRAYRKAVRSYYGSPWFSAPGVQAQPDSRGGHARVTSHGRRPRDDEEEEQEEERDTESDAEVECDLSNMEITEELRQYFATTERHRAERLRQRQLDAARLDDYVDAGHGLYPSPRSAQPPSERPGERRRAEMRLLYGEAAGRIEAMEAAAQLAFDRHCDRRRPRYWPVIPLRL